MVQKAPRCVTGSSALARQVPGGVFLTITLCLPQKQAALLNRLSELGAAGVRLDATKHIAEVLSSMLHILAHNK